MRTQTVSESLSYKKSTEQIRKVAQEFESLFSSMMLRAMRKTVGENPLIPASMGEKIYTEMLDDEYSKMLSKHSSLGLSDLIVKELEQKNNCSAMDLLKNIGNKDYSTIDNRFIRTDNLQNLKNSFSVSKWDYLITKASQDYDVDKNLISAVISQESGGNPYAISRAGAKGLMQLMDTTASDLGVSNSFSPWENIRGGVKYLRQMLDQFNGDEKLALASYNAGPSAVKKYGGIPPYPETVNYVDSVLRLKEQFSRKD